MPSSLLFRCFVGLTIFLLIYSASIGIRNVFRYNTFKIENATLEKRMQKEHKRFRQYQYEVQAMNNDDYWEQLAKKRLGLVKPNERLFKGVN